MGWPSGWTSLNPIDVVQCRQWLIGFTGEDNAKQEARPGEVLRVLREEAESQEIQRSARELSNIPEKNSLRQEVWQQPSEIDQARLQLESEKTSQKEVRSVRVGQETTGSPYRPGHYEQRAREHTDAMQAVPRLLAHYGQEAWQDGSWENGIPRTTDVVPARVDRLKAIGNGQVPLVAATAWHLLVNEGE